jgi:triosephosphate isomerase
VINRKIRAAQEAGLVVIFCVGETLAEREAGKTLEVISRQVREGLGDNDPARLIIAYEPVWAIGTGKNATPEQAQEVHGNIRNLLKKLGSNAEDVRILYGGSVKPDNIGVLMQKDDIDGALVGGASLDPVSFSKIVKY